DLYTDIVLYAMTHFNHDLKKAIQHITKHNLNMSGSILSNKVWSTKQKKILKISAKNIKAIQKSLLS
ncbi:hypothetical protein, partial [Escherichia coli]